MLPGLEQRGMAGVRYEPLMLKRIGGGAWWCYVLTLCDFVGMSKIDQLIENMITFKMVVSDENFYLLTFSLLIPFFLLA